MSRVRLPVGMRHSGLMSVAAELPPVSGRHRNRALAAARRAKAVELRTQGWTYEQITDELGYAYKGTVHNIINAVLEAQQEEAVEKLRQPEGERLDAVQLSLWEKALAGDNTAALAVVRIIATRCRLFGLGEPRVRTGGNVPRTVVVPAEQARSRMLWVARTSALDRLGRGDPEPQARPRWS